MMKRTLRLSGYDIELTALAALDEREIEMIARYLAGHRDDPRYLSEGRAVLLPGSLARRFDGIKLKGCGLLGGKVALGRLHGARYSVPRFDFEGTFLPDPARDHHRAPAGGMSYQQAVNEAKVAQYLDGKGFETLPGLGYGSVHKDGITSWFCILDAPFAPARSHIQSITTIKQAVDAGALYASTQDQLSRLDVYLTLLGSTVIDGRMVRKDFHTARVASLDDSPASLLAYQLFDLRFAFRIYEAAPFGSDAEKRQAAQSAHLETLLGVAFSPQAIRRFMSLVYRLSADPILDLSGRARLLDRDPIASLAQQQLYERFDEVATLRTILATTPVVYATRRIIWTTRAQRLIGRALGRFRGWFAPLRRAWRGSIRPARSR